MITRLRRLIAIILIASCAVTLAVSAYAIQTDNPSSANDGTVLLLSDDHNQEIGLTNIASGSGLSDGCSVFAIDSESISRIGAIQYDANNGNSIAYRTSSYSLYPIVVCKADKNTITYLENRGFFIKVSGSYRKESAYTFEQFDGYVLLKNIKRSLYPQLAVDNDTDLLARLESTGKFALKLTDDSVLVFDNDWVNFEAEIKDEYLLECRLTQEQFEEQFPLVEATPTPTPTTTPTQAVSAEPTSLATDTIDVKPTDNTTDNLNSVVSEEDIASIKAEIRQELKRSMLPVILLSILGLIGLPGLMILMFSLLHQNRAIKSSFDSVKKSIKDIQRSFFESTGRNWYNDNQTSYIGSETIVNVDNLTTKDEFYQVKRELEEKIERVEKSTITEPPKRVGDRLDINENQSADTPSWNDRPSSVEVKLIELTNSIVKKDRQDFQTLSTLFRGFDIEPLSLEEDKFKVVHFDTDYCLVSSAEVDEHYVIARANRCGIRDDRFDTIYEKQNIYSPSEIVRLPRLSKVEGVNRYTLKTKGKVK